MALIAAWSNFLGANYKVHPKRLVEGVGVQSFNLRLGFGDMRPWRDAQTVVSTGGGAQLISAYRANRAVVSDTNHWFQWATDVDVVPSLIPTDTSEEIFYTGDGEPKSTDLIIGLPPIPGPSAWRTMGVPKPEIIGSLGINTSGAGPSETRVYVTTFLNERQRESAPSEPRSIVVPGGTTVDIGGLVAPPSGSHGITLRRIYVSTDGGDFLEVLQQAADLPTATDNGIRGSVLQSGGDPSKPAWLPPPDNLKGLVQLWNGMLGGFFGKTFAASEPGKPWAWPVEYQDELFDDIVGTAVWGQSWVICTTSQPFIMRGGPALFDRQPVELQQSCLSKRSVLSMGHGVCYAGPSGLCYVGANGPPRVLTEGIVTAQEWQSLNPASIIGARFENYYIGFYNNGTPSGFIVDTLNPQGTTQLSVTARGRYYDPISDRLYLQTEGNLIKRWDAGPPLTVSFRTNIVRHPKATNPGFALIVADVPQSVQFTLYADLPTSTGSRVMTTIYSATVATGMPFALPSGYLAQDFQVLIASTGAVQGVMLGETAEDLV
jgi:hypothetical protein